jgi:phthalate 4,5-cis-dihydrodiol dehydrogenase
MNIAILGAGPFGAAHARAVAEAPGLHLVAACRTDPVALQTFVERFGVTGYLDYRAALADPRVDTVLIATPAHLHTEMAIAAARAGKHILLEKPMAPTLAECDQIIRAADDARVKLMVGYLYHFVPGYRAAKDVLDSGKLGDVILGVSTISKAWAFGKRRAWHLDRQLGGGALQVFGIHAVDVLTWMVGSRVQTVSAVLRTCFHQQPSDDVGMLFLRFENGAAGTVVCTGYRTGAPKLHVIELTCGEGTLNVQPVDGAAIGQDEQWRLIPGSGSADWMHKALIAEWQAFADAVAASAASPVSGEYGRHIMATLFAAEESSRLGKEMRVEQ